MASSFAAAASAALPGGRILRTGGAPANNWEAPPLPPSFSDSVDVFPLPDGSTRWIIRRCHAPITMNDERFLRTATLIPSGTDAGQVLIAGGDEGSTAAHRPPNCSTRQPAHFPASAALVNHVSMRPEHDKRPLRSHRNAADSGTESGEILFTGGSNNFFTPSGVLNSGRIVQSGLQHVLVRRRCPAPVPRYAIKVSIPGGTDTTGWCSPRVPTRVTS